MNFKNYMKNVHQKCKYYYLPVGITYGLLTLGLICDTSDQEREKVLKRNLESLNGMVMTHEYAVVKSQEDNAFLYVSYHQLLENIIDIGLINSQRNTFYNISEKLCHLSSYTVQKGLDNKSNKQFAGIMTTEMYTYYMNRVTGMRDKDARHYLHALISAVYLHDHKSSEKEEEFVAVTGKQLYDLGQGVNFATTKGSFSETFNKYLVSIKK